MERIRSGSYHPLCYSQDPTDGHAQIGCTFDHWRMQLTATAMIVIFPQSHKFEGASSTDICVSTRCTRNLILSWKEIIRAHIFDLVSEVPPSCTNPTMHSHGALGNTSAALYALCVEPHFNFASWLGLNIQSFRYTPWVAGSMLRTRNPRNLESNPG